MYYIGIFYLAFQMFFLFQKPEHGREIFSAIFPETKHYPARSQIYSDISCDFNLRNVYDNLDQYAICHFFGWFLASFITRDYRVLLLWQLQDEFVELSYKNIYFPFVECWWDQVINDVLLCNLNGIFLGILVQKLLNMERFDFFGRYAEDGKKLPFKQWRVFNCHRHLGFTILMFLFFKLNFINRFFVMNGFNLYPKHRWTLARLWLYLYSNA